MSPGKRMCRGLVPMVCIAVSAVTAVQESVLCGEGDALSSFSHAAVADRHVYKAGAVVFGVIPAHFTVVLEQGPPEGADEARRAFRAALEAVARVNRVFSSYLPDSELSRFNRWAAGKPFPASGEFTSLVVRCRRFWEASGGAFDPSIKPVLDVYKRMRRGEDVPEDVVGDAERRVGFDGVEVRWDGSLIKKRPGLSLDFGGVAKGLGIDLAVRALEEAGVSGGIVEIGGDLKVFGNKPGGEDWEIGISDPLRPSSLAFVLRVPSGRTLSIVTSGDYEQKWSWRGREFTHIVNPFTRKPMEYRGRGVTLALPDAAAADAFATACFVLPEELAFELAERQGAALMVVNGRPDGKPDVRMNAGMKVLAGDVPGEVWRR